MKIKTKDLTGPALDWAVGDIEFKRLIAEGAHVKQWVLDAHKSGAHTDPYSTDWQTCGPIIEGEGISTMFHDHDHWTAANLKGTVCAEGPTPLIAAMRCYCCSKLGDAVDVPEELCQAQNS